MLSQVFLNIGYRGDEHQIPAKTARVYGKIYRTGART